MSQSQLTPNAKFSLQNLFWPLLVLVLGGLALLQALAVFPPAIADLIGRSWPVVLVIAGLAFLLEQFAPLRRWAWLVSLLAAAALIAGIVTVSYSIRAAEMRTDNVVPFTQALGADVERLNVEIEGLQTGVEVSLSLAEAAVITAEYTGSSASVIEPVYSEQNNTATFAFIEARPEAIPLLEEVGRGQMRIELPPGVPVALTLRSAEGSATLNLGELALAALNVDVQAGDLLLTLPPRSLDVAGSVLVQRGSLTLFVPESLGLRLIADRTPEFGDTLSFVRSPNDPPGLWRTEGLEDYDAQMELNLNAPGGTISVEPQPAS